MRRGRGHLMTMDTDAAALVAGLDAGLAACPRPDTPDPARLPDGTEAIGVLSYEHVERVVHRFASLNPFERSLVPGSPWKVEHDSLARPVWGYALASKRDCLFRFADGDTPADFDPTRLEIVKASELGLGGVFLDPTATDPDRPARDDQGRFVWVKEVWRWILAEALGRPFAAPEFFDRLAVSRYVIATPKIAACFEDYSATRNVIVDEVRAGGFGLLAHPLVGDTPGLAGIVPVGGYETAPERWPSIDWFDRATGKRLVIHVGSLYDDEGYRHDDLAPETIPLQTIGDVVARYRRAVEWTKLPPHADQWHPHATGLLRRRPVTSSPGLADLVGEEGFDADDPITAFLAGNTILRLTTCDGCGQPLTGKQHRWCSPRCESAARRAAQPTQDPGRYCAWPGCSAQLRGRQQRWCARHARASGRARWGIPKARPGGVLCSSCLRNEAFGEVPPDWTCAPCSADTTARETETVRCPRCGINEATGAVPPDWICAQCRDRNQEANP